MSELLAKAKALVSRTPKADALRLRGFCCSRKRRLGCPVGLGPALPTSAWMFERFGKTFASACVDASIGRRCKSRMPELRQLAHDLRTDESGSSDYYDLHDFAFR